MSIRIPHFSLALLLLLPLAYPAAGQARLEASGWGNRGALFVREQRIDVKIHDVAAVTEVVQIFGNRRNRQLEGIYTFQIPEEATIDDFSMWIAGKEKKGVVLEKERARQIYEHIVRRRIDPGLVELVGHRTIRISVFPIPPLGDVKFRLRYSQLLRDVGGIHEYTYPVGEMSREEYRTVTMKLRVKSSPALRFVHSPTHRLRIRRPDDHTAEAKVLGLKLPRSKVFQLFLRPRKDAFGLTLLTHCTRKNGGFFMLVASPDIAMPEGQTVQRDVVFVLDTSGSMAGDKIEQARSALVYCLKNLGPRDRFNIVSFGTDVETYAEKLTPSDAGTVAKAVSFARDLEACGGTNIDGALQAAFGQRETRGSETQGRLFLVVFLTDGKPTVGERNPRTIRRHVRDWNRKKDRLFVFGVGDDVDPGLLDGLVQDHRGASEYVRPGEDLELKLTAFYDKTAGPVLANVKVDFGRATAKNLHPKDMPDLFQGSQVVAFGRYRPTHDQRATIALTGKIAGQRTVLLYPVRLPRKCQENEFIPRLWAWRRVKWIMKEITRQGEHPELKSEIIRLGRRWGIVTPYTSFLVVEDGAPIPPPRPRPRRSRRGGGGGPMPTPRTLPPGDHPTPAPPPPSPSPVPIPVPTPSPTPGGSTPPPGPAPAPGPTPVPTPTPSPTPMPTPTPSPTPSPAPAPPASSGPAPLGTQPGKTLPCPSHSGIYKSSPSFRWFGWWLRNHAPSLCGEKLPTIIPPTPLPVSALRPDPGAARATPVKAVGREERLKIVEELGKGLEAKQASVRTECALALGCIGHGTPSVREGLRRNARSKDPAVAASAVLALGLIGDADSFELLSGILVRRSTPPRVAAAAALALGFLGGGDALIILGQVAENPSLDLGLRTAAMIAIGRIDHPAVREKLLRCVTEDRHHAIKIGSIASLACLGDEKVAIEGREDYVSDVLGNLLRERRCLPAVSRALALALGRLGSESSLPTLERTLRVSRDTPTRCLSILAIGRILGRNAPDDRVRFLQAFLESDRDPTVRACAALALGACAGRQAPEALRVIFEKSVEPDLRTAAALGLGMCGERSALPDLAREITHPRTGGLTRFAAAYAMGRTGDPAALSYLKAVMDQTPAPGLRFWAALGLGELRCGEAFAPLSDASREKDAIVRKGALYGLGRLQSPAARSALLYALRAHPDTGTRALAARLLGFAAQGEPGRFLHRIVVTFPPSTLDHLPALASVLGCSRR
jgi:Ca-activated chloride channel family protein